MGQQIQLIFLMPFPLNTLILYADDACLYTSDNSLAGVAGVVKSLQAAFNRMSKWHRENLMCK